MSVCTNICRGVPINEQIIVPVVQMSLFSLVTCPRPQFLDGNETEKFYQKRQSLRYKKDNICKDSPFLFDKNESH